MKKAIAGIIMILTLGALIAQVTFVPDVDIFSLTTFKKEKPYFENSYNLDLHFRLQAFPQAYFVSGFQLGLTDNPLRFFHPDKKKREPIETFYLDAALTFPTMGGTDTYFSIFDGEYDQLNSDKILRETAKVKMDTPEFYRYFPTSAFKPDIPVEGIGCALYGNANSLPVYCAGYVYWNGLTTKDTYTISADFRTGYSFPGGALNFFTGARFCSQLENTALRAGISGVFRTGDTENYEFYFDANIINLTFPVKNIEKKLSILFETRGIYDKFNFSIPFFMSPVSSLPSYMDQAQYADSTFIGLGAKIAGGNLEKYNFEAGASICTSVNPKNVSKLTAFTFSISPFYKQVIGGYLLDFMVHIYPALYKNPIDMFNMTIQFKAVR